ncbi:MAG: ImmA/IrrE family metallo-endopeptidase [Planctomycetota bacterium]|nr:ImmA/IrrE family metallo-endopeptidase [Planctomycetota bacterium]
MAFIDVDRALLERTAKDVLDAHGVATLSPVDPFALAELEKIHLAPGTYDNCFDGRIEYHRSSSRGRFFLFYALKGPGRPEGKVRFSVAHELGHYFLPRHREFLMSGQWHGSKTGFISDRKTEREADYFAAALLMPEVRFTAEVHRRANGVCDLRNLIDLADRVFQTSIISTVIRYTHLNFEPSTIVLSKAGKILYSIASEDMRSSGLGWIDREGRVPALSVTRRATAAGPVAPYGPRDLVRDEVQSDVWYPERHPRALWEEVHRFGEDLALTFLTIDDDDGSGEGRDSWDFP